MIAPRLVVAALAAALLTLSPSPARAQGTGARKKPATPRKILRLEELKVEGRIRKPQAMFLMPRANLGYGELDRVEPLLPKVTRAVEKEPF